MKTSGLRIAKKGEDELKDNATRAEAVINSSRKVRKELIGDAANLKNEEERGRSGDKEALDGKEDKKTSSDANSISNSK